MLSALAFLMGKFKEKRQVKSKKNQVFEE